MRPVYTLRRSRAADWARLCGGVSVPVLVLAALGARIGLIPSNALLAAVIVGFVLGLLAFGIAVYALIDIWNSGADGVRAAAAAIIYALPVLALLGLIATAAVIYPRLTDVTTDPDDPPEFVAANAPGRNFSVEDIKAQDAAYPDLVTHDYPLPLGQVYAAVRKLILSRGWTLTRDSRPVVMPQASPSANAPPIEATDDVEAAIAQKKVMTQSRGGAERQPNAAPGVLRLGNGSVATLEATARTPVFGFLDSVAVRLRGTGDGTEIDMRSASHIGEHDLGQNARRIRAFFKSLDEMLQPASTGPGIASASQ